MTRYDELCLLLILRLNFTVVWRTTHCFPIKFKLKPPYGMVCENFSSATWNSSFWISFCYVCTQGIFTKKYLNTYLAPGKVFPIFEVEYLYHYWGKFKIWKCDTISMKSRFTSMVRYLFYTSLLWPDVELQYYTVFQ